jgi:hypothetical protein
MTPAVPPPANQAERAQPNMETEAGPIRQLFRDALKALTQPAPKPSPPTKRKRAGDDDKGRAGMRLPFRYAVLRRAAVTSGIARAPFKQGRAIIRQAPPPTMDADTRGFVPDPLDSMNPYCEPDACVIEIDGVDDDYKPPQDYYPLQL